MQLAKLLRLASFAAMLLPLSARAQLIEGYGVKVGLNASTTNLENFIVELSFK